MIWFWMTLTLMTCRRLDYMFPHDSLNTNPVEGVWIRVYWSRPPSFVCFKQELNEREHLVYFNFLKNWGICVYIVINFWSFDKYFTNYSPPHPTNVSGSPLHPCWKILNVNRSTFEFYTTTVHCCLPVTMFVQLVLDDPHIDDKSKTWSHVPAW